MPIPNSDAAGSVRHCNVGCKVAKKAPVPIHIRQPDWKYQGRYLPYFIKNESFGLYAKSGSAALII